MITNLTTLKAAVLSYTRRTDQSNNLDLFVQLAEGRINREVRTSARTSLQETTLSSGVPTFDLPSDFLETDAFGFGTADAPPKIVSPKEFAMREAAGVESNVPEIRMIYGNKMRFYPTPSADHAIFHYYHQKSDLATTTTNNLLVEHPDLFLYATVAELAESLGDDDLMARANARLERIQQAIARADSNRRYKGGYLETNPR